MERMRRASGGQLVYSELRRRILSLELEPGQRLYEPELAASLQVSRTPLREALRLLLAEDLIDQLPTGGMVVRPLTAGDIEELYSVRAALEGLMAAEAARPGTRVLRMPEPFNWSRLNNRAARQAPGGEPGDHLLFLNDDTRMLTAGWDRRLRGSVAAMVLGSVIIYTIGVSWLAIAANLSLDLALQYGLYPFLPGDILKLLVAAGLLPVGWRLVSRRDHDL